MQGQQPQYSQAYDPSPQPGYNQQPAYGQAPSGYGYPQPMYMPVAAPPKKDNTVAIVVVVVLVVVMLVIIVPVAWVFFMMNQAMTSSPSMSGSSPPIVSTRVEKNSNGDWLVTIVATGGTQASLSSTRLQVVNQTTSAMTVNSYLSSSSSSDFQYNDNDANGKVNAGDTILLRHTSSNIHSGDTVKLYYSGDTISSRTLP